MSPTKHVMNYALQAGLTWLDDTIERGSQSWTRKVLVEWRGYKLRATVSRDFYDAQSSIFVEAFVPSTLTWNRLDSRSGKDHAYLTRSSDKDDLAIIASSDKLVDSLLAYAQTVLE